MLDGFVNLLKPPGPSSHDLVAYVRRLTGIKRVGHTGTLDPLAAGVLAIAIGRATRLIQYLDDTKSYVGEITFGLATDSLDAAGDLVADQPLHLDSKQLEATLEKFTGTILQVPPMVSALKWRGRRLYDLARAGIEVDRPPRVVSITELELLSIEPDQDYPSALVKCACSAGTYIRSLAADIGKDLNCNSYLSFLLRIQTGPFSIAESLTLEKLKNCLEKKDDFSWLIRPHHALSNLPDLILAGQDVFSFTHGNPINLRSNLIEQNAAGPVCVCDQQRRFLGVGYYLPGQPARLQPKVVFN